ncbi:ABC transporter permease [Micromonospora sp. WMMD1076]|uniref:ABC transporter permease n=1 Tax=Micromonospora sp. WMMD1076 TaxID=3016103 RepID=UPI00249AB552|nr:ABC transporter permease [Micromonospora sp. WMMD1076]WFF04601.1 ABC transporter permease [Micromonospora sp. WMMD1076]
MTGVTDTTELTAVAAQAPRARTATSERVAALAQRHGAPAVLLLAGAVSALVFPAFATADNLSGIAIQSATLAIVALGMTFVIISGGIDLSVGSVFALGGVLAAWASQYGTVAALLVPLAVCGGIGLLNGLVIARTGLEPFIVTLASLLGARGLLLAITGEGATTYLVPKDAALLDVGRGTLLGVGYPVFVAALLCVLGALLLQRTGYGQAVFAVGGNAEAAALMGLPVARVKVLTYVLSGLLAGLAGVLNTARLGSGVTILGVGLELDAIAAVVIGGTLLIGGAGSVSGSLCGVLLLGVIQNVINQIGNLTSSLQSVVSGAFLVVVVVTQTYLSRIRRLR